MEFTTVIQSLKSHASADNVAGMARFGIKTQNILGVNVPILRKLAKDIKKDLKTNETALHALAQKLWHSQIHEARLLASMIEVPQLVSVKQLNAWVNDFDTWDVCDQTCMNLIDKTPFAYQLVKKWAKSSREFTRRAGFALIAVLAWHDKTAPDAKLTQFFPLIKKYSTDDRNYVKKAVNWALRQIGKRNQTLRPKAIKLAHEIIKINSPSARWIAGDALRELQRR